MKFVKKTLALMLCAALVLTTLAGCGASSSSAVAQKDSTAQTQPQEPVVLEWWFEGATPERTEMFQKLVETFNAQNPDIKVNGTFLENGKGMDKLNVAIAGESTPDICTLQPSWLSNLFAQDVFVPLDDRFAAWEDGKNLTEDFMTVVRNASPDGKLYGIPQAGNLYGVWFRKDIYAEKGLPAPGTSWDDFFGDIEATTDTAARVYGHTIRGGGGAFVQVLYPLIAYAGYDNFFDADGKAQVLRSDEGKEFLTRFASIYQKGEAPQSSLTATFKEMAADYTAGIAMSYIHNMGSYDALSKAMKPDQFALAMFPPSPSTKKSTTSMPTVKVNAMFKSCENQDAAWRFMQFLASQESDTAINQMTGELPVRQDTLELDWAKEAPQLKETIPFLKDNTKISVVYPNYMPDFQNLASQTGDPAFQELLTGKITVDQFVETMATAMEEAYAYYKSK
ncbi:MAG: sugar ABC transporter substrate-binding protein [Ruthenibacterium sp.]